MKSKKMISVLIAFVFAISLLLSGCSGENNESTAQTTTKTQSQSTEDNSNKLVELSLGSSSYTDIVDNSLVQQYIEKTYNVKLKIVRFPVENTENLVGLLIASDSLPDVFLAPPPSNVQKYVNQGAIGEIPLETMEKFMPRQYKAINDLCEKIGQSVWKIRAAADGKNYQIPGIAVDASLNNSSRAWRMDILKKIGITELPNTIAEFETVFQKIKEYDSKLYGLSGMGKESYWSFAYDIYNAYIGTPDEWFYNEKTGKIENTLVQPEMKEALRTLQNWFKAGYIDPEWLTDTRATSMEKLYNGRVLSTCPLAWWHTYPDAIAEWNWENTYVLAQKIQPEADLVLGANVRGPNGKSGLNVNLPFAHQLWFSKKMASDPVKVERFMKIHDDGNFIEDFHTLMYYGEKEVHWNMTEDGKMNFLPSADTAEEKAMIGSNMFFAMFFTTGIAAEINFPKYQRSERTLKWADDNLFVKYADYNEGHLNIGTFVIIPDELLKSSTEDLTELWQGTFSDIIYDIKSIDTFDTFVKKWLDGGGKARTDYMNENGMKYFTK